MLLPGEAFPYKPITDKDKKWIMDCCGGSPVTDPVRLRTFLTLSGLPALERPLIRSVFNGIAWRTVNAFDHSDRRSVQSLNRGILFYAGVAAEIGGINPVPFRDEPIQEVSGADAKNLVIDSMQRVATETEGFVELLESMRPAMQTETDNQQHAFVLMGAGLMHIVSTSSLELINSDAQMELDATITVMNLDPFSEYARDPEMVALNRMFDELG